MRLEEFDGGRMDEPGDKPAVEAPSRVNPNARQEVAATALRAWATATGELPPPTLNAEPTGLPAGEVFGAHDYNEELCGAGTTLPQPTHKSPQ